MAFGQAIRPAWAHQDLRSRFALDCRAALEMRREAMSDALCDLFPYTL